MSDDLTPIDPDNELADVVELNDERRKLEARYAELKASKPKKGSEPWKELMRLGRLRSGNQGGRPKKLTKAEAREAALRELYPKALKVLGRQIDEYLEPTDILDDDGNKIGERRGDASAARAAALRVIDQVEGKAAQTIKEEKVHKIVYVTAAADDEADAV